MLPEPVRVAEDFVILRICCEICCEAFLDLTAACDGIIVV